MTVGANHLPAEAELSDTLLHVYNMFPKKYVGPLFVAIRFNSTFVAAVAGARQLFIAAVAGASQLPAELL